MDKKDQAFVLETIKIMRPASSNKIFNEEDFMILQTTDENGDKLVILRSK